MVLLTVACDHGTTYCDMFPWYYLLWHVSMVLLTVTCFHGTTYCDMFPWYYLLWHVSMVLLTVTCFHGTTYCDILPLWFEVKNWFSGWHNKCAFLFPVHLSFLFENNQFFSLILFFFFCLIAITKLITSSNLSIEVIFQKCCSWTNRARFHWETEKWYYINLC